MILSNVALHSAIDGGRLVITPEPSPRFPQVGYDHCPYGTHSVDLRLSEQINVPINTGVIAVDLTRPGDITKFLKDNARRLTITAEQPYILEQGKFVLGQTLEEVSLPIAANCKKCLAARIEGKSSRARFGILIHFTAPTVHPGYNGTLTLEMINLGPWPFVLSPEMYIAQLIVEEVRGCPIENPSQFQGQTTPAGTSEKTDI